MARYGENIRKRADGRWEARYKDYDMEKNRVVYRSVYGATYNEAKEKKFSALQALRQSAGEKEQDGQRKAQKRDRQPEVVQFLQVAEEWLETVQNKCKHSTYIKYKTIYKIYLESNIGLCKLSDIMNQELREKISDHLSVNNLSESIQKSICCVMNQILAFANRKYSVCIPVLKLPSVKAAKKPIVVLSQAEQIRLFACFDNQPDRSRAAIQFCLYTGMRLGELCALKWTDFDFKSMTVTVGRTVQRIAVNGYTTKTSLQETAPKSESSKRTIPLTNEIIRLLESFNKEEPYVFGGSKPLEPRTMQYQFKKILSAADIESRHFHILRHTFATNCVENGMDVKVLSEILGHSDVKITLNRYVHPTMDSKRKQIGRLSGFYGQICGQVA